MKTNLDFESLSASSMIDAQYFFRARQPACTRDRPVFPVLLRLLVGTQVCIPGSGGTIYEYAKTEEHEAWNSTKGQV